MMANTRMIFLPFAAEFWASNYPQLTLVNRRPVLAFDADTIEMCMWTGVAPQGMSGTLAVVVTYMMASATSGSVSFMAMVEAVSDGDAIDLAAAESFDTANVMSAAAVPGIAGYIDQVTITLTNKDNIAPGDYFRLALLRDAEDSMNDTASGDCYVLAVELRDNV